jgi:hypothetical protein
VSPIGRGEAVAAAIVTRENPVTRTDVDAKLPVLAYAPALEPPTIKLRGSAFAIRRGASRRNSRPGSK